MCDLIGAKIHITGVVQGVGFRPFIYGLAKRYKFVGWVRNTSAGVDIEVDTKSRTLNEFVKALKTEAPPLAHIDSIDVTRCSTFGFSEFEIRHSAPNPGEFQPLSPDVSLCSDCYEELFDPTNRRYLYPFINCTNCGPRFTIIQDIPYDRPFTTMSSFDMCPDCTEEYQNPLDRRFHAQPIACPECGPHIWLENKNLLNAEADQPIKTQHRLLETSKITIRTVQELLDDGKIIAVKGIGGFHLACDALNRQAVRKLRNRKLRVDKPFALMAPDIITISEHCYINSNEKKVLTSRERPIVILKKKPSSLIANEVAPGQDTLGFMLPYTPLHHLLFTNLENEKKSSPRILVMTSGNLSEEPIAVTNHEARDRLGTLADTFLMHNRPIHTRCDDSVVRILPNSQPKTKPIDNLKENGFYPIRRSRGYAPYPVQFPWHSPPILAAGAHLKNTFCLTRDNYAFLSQHIGDLENYETLTAFESSIEHFERLFRVQPEVFAYDLHPDYLATRYVIQRSVKEDLPAVGVQHHHAHIAACMTENNLPPDEKVIGLAYDGIGFGEDGAIWGGEILIADYKDYKRPYHLKYVSMPGGDLATLQPWRMALSWISALDFEWDDDLIPIKFIKNQKDDPNNQLSILHHQITHKVNAPYTSSMGRLFDAVASLIGVRQLVNYEAQAAIELESLCNTEIISQFKSSVESHSSHITPLYPIRVPTPDLDLSQEIDPGPLLARIIEDISRGIKIADIAAYFHIALAIMSVDVCIKLREATSLDQVVLSGGVWQNTTLIGATLNLLLNNGFKTFIHNIVPTNDGGLALGQAAVTAHRLQH